MPDPTRPDGPMLRVPGPDGPTDRALPMSLAHPFVIGSAVDCDLRLDDQPGVLAHHCHIIARDDGLFLMPGDGNTTVGGRAVPMDGVRLVHDAAIRLGTAEQGVTLHYIARPAAPQETPAGDGWLKRVQIFVSSPGDVQEERQAIRRVIERLNRLASIRDRYLLVPLLYEEVVPPHAGDHAQMIVDRYMAVETSYLVICLMWDRMGTPFTHPGTGQHFDSGTAYEFNVAYDAQQRSGLPHLLLYRKTAANPAADPEQKALVDAFFARFHGEQAAYRGLYATFEDSAAFESMLLDHIDQLLYDSPPAGSVPAANQAAPPPPEIVEEDRRLDAAMPRTCEVNRPTEVRVMLCLPDSAGLKAMLPDVTEHGDLIDKRDVAQSALAVAFKRDPEKDSILPEVVEVRLNAPDFSIDQPAQKVRLTYGKDSGLVVFGVTPQVARQRSLVRVSVTAQDTTGDAITLGGIALYTDAQTEPVAQNEMAWFVSSRLLSQLQGGATALMIGSLQVGSQLPRSVPGSRAPRPAPMPQDRAEVAPPMVMSTRGKSSSLVPLLLVLLMGLAVVIGIVWLLAQRL